MLFMLLLLRTLNTEITLQSNYPGGGGTLTVDILTRARTLVRSSGPASVGNTATRPETRNELQTDFFPAKICAPLFLLSLALQVPPTRNRTPQSSNATALPSQWYSIHNLISGNRKFLLWWPGDPARTYRS